VDKNVPLNAMTKVVEILAPLSSEDRARVVGAALALLGDIQVKAPLQSLDDQLTDESDLGVVAPRTKHWMGQNGISVAEVQQVFHVTDGKAEVIAALPGRNKKEQTYSAYVLTGLGQFLVTGNAAFTDKAARSLCEASGCYDSANHAAYLKDRGSEFTGSKEKGWTLTVPGLKRGADLLKELSSSSDRRSS
jgi:hypothetical protein